MNDPQYDAGMAVRREVMAPNGFLHAASVVALADLVEDPLRQAVILVEVVEERRADGTVRRLRHQHDAAGCNGEYQPPVCPASSRFRRQRLAGPLRAPYLGSGPGIKGVKPSFNTAVFRIEGTGVDVDHILAAGEGKRMRSRQPKVLHPLCGRPLIAYPLRLARALADRVVLVLGPEAESVREIAGPDVRFVDIREDAHLLQVLRENEERRSLKARLHGLSRVDGAADHHSVDRRDDLRVAEVRLRLAECGRGLRDLRACGVVHGFRGVDFRLRVGIKGGGCSGFSYILDLTETRKETDEAFEQHGITIICDPKSLLYLNGTTVDFKDEIMGRGFVFQNPNATTTCGCGSSFAV